MKLKPLITLISIMSIILFTLILHVKSEQHGNSQVKKTDIIHVHEGSVRDTYLFLNEAVPRCLLNGNQKIQGINFKSDTAMYFYPNGKIRAGFLNGNQTIQGINFKKFKFDKDRIDRQGWNVEALAYAIFFYDNGQIKSGRLNGNQTIHGTNYPDNYAIDFNSDGTVKQYLYPR